MEISKETGIPQNTISWIEKEKGIANMEQCIKLANYYQMSLEELVEKDFRKQTQKTRIKYYKCKF